MLNTMLARTVGALVTLGLVGCASAGGDAGSQASTSSSLPTAQQPSPTVTVASAGAPPSPSCRPRAPTADDPIESHTQTVRQTAGQGVAVEYGALNDTNTPLWRLLPTLSEAGRVTAMAPTFTDGPHGPVYAALLEKPERRADGTATTSLHFGLAAAPCPGGEHAWMGMGSGTAPLIPLARERSGAIVIVDSIWLPGQPPITGLRILVDKPPVDQLGQFSANGEVLGLLVGQGRPGMPVLEPEGAAIGVLGRIPRLAGPLSPGSAAAQPQEDVLLFGTGWYPLGRGAAMLAYHRQGPGPRASGDQRTDGFFPPAFRLVARIDERGFSTDPARVGVAYVIAIATNQPPAGVCDKPLSEGPGYLCRGADSRAERFIDGSRPQWLVGLFPDALTAQKTMTSLRIQGKVYATEPPPGAPPPAQPDGKPAPWVLEGRPPKPVKERLLGF
jgi:hypothetical protein